MLVLCWLCWYYVGCYTFAKCRWKIKVVEKNKDAVRFYMKVLMAARNRGFTLVCCKSRRKERRKEVVIEYHLIHIQLGTLGLKE